MGRLWSRMVSRDDLVLMGTTGRTLHDNFHSFPIIWVILSLYGSIWL